MFSFGVLLFVFCFYIFYFYVFCLYAILLCYLVDVHKMFEKYCLIIFVGFIFLDTCFVNIVFYDLKYCDQNKA